MHPPVPPSIDAVAGPWSPLKQPTFRSLWLAILIGNIGTWIHDVAATWVMAEATGSPLMVAMVQSATTLPLVLLAIVAGALADIVDRRRYLILAQLWMCGVAGLLALLAHLDLLRPWTLIALTFALGIGAAMAMPAQQATTPELVPRPMLGPAVALGSLGINIARAIGPALGGLVVARAGIEWAFAINALSFCGIVAVLLRWKRERPASSLPPEDFATALKAGLRYVRYAGVVQSVLIKSGIFFAFASALTALLPILVRQELRASAGTYGLMLGCIGLGAICGALTMPRLRARFSSDRLVLFASLAYAGCMLLSGGLRLVPALYAVAALAGFSWIIVLSSLQVAAQTAVPAWVRARALSLYITVFSAGMALGSLGWGAVAQQWGTATALVTAGLATVLAAGLGVRFRLDDAERLDVSPSRHWPEPAMEAGEGIAHAGPIVVTIEYRVLPTQRGEFLRLMQRLGRTRRRDGAVRWELTEDAQRPGVHRERFELESWLAHLRQHERVTGDERRLQEQLLQLLEPGTRPEVRHFGLHAPEGNGSDAKASGHGSAEDR
ncbi:MFS transporter [Lysobacter arvi]|uniref:MFS transporter n=1 Tax=Lysobacter arvi TaxID=3038776 RepID=A0ABU1C9U6_9GAMM|nr:MFS transporter [Lysobacter arvi]MDR0181962.1 MFS transporter [Lysobacter arvi]